MRVACRYLLTVWDTILIGRLGYESEVSEIRWAGDEEHYRWQALVVADRLRLVYFSTAKVLHWVVCTWFTRGYL